MPAITVRNVPAKVVQSLKALARRHNRSMEQEVRDLIGGIIEQQGAYQLRDFGAEILSIDRLPKPADLRVRGLKLEAEARYRCGEDGVAGGRHDWDPRLAASRSARMAAHRWRMGRLLGDARAARPDLRLAGRDPWALRLMAMTLLIVRTRTEEAKLVERFGDDYRDLMARTGLSRGALTLALGGAVIGALSLSNLVLWTTQWLTLTVANTQYRDLSVRLRHVLRHAQRQQRPEFRRAVGVPREALR